MTQYAIVTDLNRCVGGLACSVTCKVVKCTLCEQKIAQGELPQCVTQCGGRARYFGDLDQGIAGFEGPAPIDITLKNVDYDATVQSRAKLSDEVEPYAEGDVHRLPNVGNNPSFVYILRNRTWQGGDE